ncbi:twin-arginine translocation pathway signal sequence bacterial/archaeal [Lucifera butyrica]|uniref:Twin-arginine translocation pathway signal sequence bacterial/archaeal n=1 Tax=Lucifera butyrica TaxID=1351585 RepID=A0A498R6G6_9FIRM|nr:twin-arginine translocation signal domain-containing protein [Lucifera butyrica]VBB06490.1 twin-arginine translocation pathway signal sequence bacterial/archaeal [Lucifera butyrica]
MEIMEGINRRNFIKGSAVVGGMLAAGGLWRAVETGIFNAGQGPAYEAWGKSYGGFEGLINAAILAANAHNSQPWLFKLGDSSIDVKADTNRNLGPADPYLREMYISLGCAVENITIAAKAMGYSPQITYFPNEQDNRHIAKMELAAGIPFYSELHAAIPKRHMNRGPYDTNHPVSQEAIEALMNLNPEESAVKLFVFDSPKDKLRIGEAMVEATKAFIADKEQIAVDSKWTRLSWKDIEKYKDGITIDSQGLPAFIRVIAKMLPPMSQEKNNQFWLDTLKNKQVGTAAAFGFIAVRDLADYQQIVKAGQLWQRIHLWATVQGLGMQIINQLSERRDRELALGLPHRFGDTLREILKVPQWHSVIQFRMGYPTIEALPSPRRPIKDVISNLNAS